MTLNIHDVDNICQAQCHPIASKRLQTLDATHLSSGQVGLDADGFLGPAQRCSRCQLAGVWLDKKMAKCGVFIDIYIM